MRFISVSNSVRLSIRRSRSMNDENQNQPVNLLLANLFETQTENERWWFTQKFYFRTNCFKRSTKKIVSNVQEVLVDFFMQFILNALAKPQLLKGWLSSHLSWFKTGLSGCDTLFDRLSLSSLLIVLLWLNVVVIFDQIDLFKRLKQHCISI